MPALPSDIAAAIRERIVVSDEDTSIKTRFPTARDNSTDPAEGFFDLPEDAQTAVSQRASLIGETRRRFAVTVADIVDIVPGTIPTHRVIDSEQGLDAPMLLARIEVDLEQDITQMEYFG